MQRRLGVAGRMDQVGRHVLRPVLTLQHRDFYPLLPFVVIGAVDPEGDAWATLRAGHPGFLHAPDPRHLAVDAARDPGDPAERGLEDGDAIGLLGIELETRRRNRLNGRVVRQDGHGFEVLVEQSFGNCPRFITPRRHAFARDPAQAPASPPISLDAADGRAENIMAAANSFFVATYVDAAGGRQVDVSHRGGPRGFVHPGADGALTVPDYAGNMFFNTLGNILLNPKAGLVFLDHATGSLLQMTGDAALLPDMPEPSRFPGAERLWQFRPRRMLLRPDALPLRWDAEATHSV